MQHKYQKETAPFIPNEETFTDYEDQTKAKAETNLLAALFDMHQEAPTKLSFDEDHFQKFLKEEQQDLRAKNTTTKRKR